jgi:periplasmic divalent cation tolerance protein
MAGAIVVLITAGGLEEARRLADALLDEHLAACVNILPRAESAYWWRGKKERTQEILLIAKSRAGRLDAIIARVKALHSYELPEIIALPVAGGNPAYLDWLHEETA